MILTNEQYEVFEALFSRISNWKHVSTKKAKNVYKIVIMNTNTVRHRLLIFLLVNDLLAIFIETRHRFLTLNDLDFFTDTNNNLSANISSTYVSFQWTSRWTKIFNSFQDEYNSVDKILKLIKDKE